MKLKNNKILFSADDVWDGDKVLARIISSFLRKYRGLYNKKKKYICYGYPPTFIQGDPWEDQDNEANLQNWLASIDEMIYVFEWIGAGKPLEGPAFNDLNNLEKPIPDIYDPLFEAHRKRIQDGIDLFARYFLHLWI